MIATSDDGRTMPDRGAYLRREVDLVTPEELATTLEVELSTLQAWRAQGTGPDYVRLGKQVFYRRADIIDWINANVVVNANRRVA